MVENWRDLIATASIRRQLGISVVLVAIAGSLMNASVSQAVEQEGEEQTAEVDARELFGWTHDPPPPGSEVPVFLGTGPSPSDLEIDIETDSPQSGADVSGASAPEPGSLILMVICLLLILTFLGQTRQRKPI